jgi:uncharacterized DUF497 family protein
LYVYLVEVPEKLTFDWNRSNVAHIGRHKVTWEEVEQVFTNDPVDLAAEIVEGERRYTSVGHTDLLRVLVVAWTMRGEAIRAVTAFKAPKKLAKRYLTEVGLDL